MKARALTGRQLLHVWVSSQNTGLGCNQDNTYLEIKSNLKSILYVFLSKDLIWPRVQGEAAEVYFCFLLRLKDISTIRYDEPAPSQIFHKDGCQGASQLMNQSKAGLTPLPKLVSWRKTDQLQAF